MKRAIAVKFDNPRYQSYQTFEVGTSRFGGSSFTGYSPYWALGKFLDYDLESREVIYTEEQLLDKKRRLQILLNNLSQPATGYSTTSNNNMSNSWNFPETDFPRMNPLIKNVSRRSLNKIWDDTLNGNAVIRLLEQGLANVLFCENGTCEKYPGDGDRYRIYFPFLPKGPTAGIGSQLPNTFSIPDNLAYARDIIENEFIKLIDDVLACSDSTLSRQVDIIEQTRVTLPVRINLKTIGVPLLDAILSASNKAIDEKTLTFFDDAREYKTILNFGNDSQYVIESLRVAPTNSRAIQFKLLSSLDSNVLLNDTAFIVREVAKSIVDSIEFELGPLPDTSPYLRPMNIDQRYSTDKIAIQGVTLTTLGVATGSTGVIVNNNLSYGDTVFRKWFTADFNSSELNIDFSNYANFVHFGSAYDKLIAFSNKLTKIIELDGYTTASTLSGTGGASIKSLEKENIIRNFDPYEQFLYFTTQSFAYSASVYYTDSGVEYHTTGSWPKQTNGTLYPPTHPTASAWLDTQGAIAQRYDEYNPNKLIKHLPEHIQNDIESQEFLTFVSMIGHFMDNIKVYIDQFTNIYSTNPDPFKELSMDQVYEVASSFGLKLPNAYSLENLQTFIASVTGDTGTRSSVAETWKRFLHSLIYVSKTKGSRTAADVLLNIYGINSPILQVKETAYPTNDNYIRSDELTYGVEFTSSLNTHLKIPFVSSSLSASSLQLRFIPTKRQTSSVVTGDTWAVNLVPHPSSSTVTYLSTISGSTFEVVGVDKKEYGRLEIVSGSNKIVIATSSYFPLFSDDYTNIMLRSQSADFMVVQTDGDQILFQESASVSLGNLWKNTQFIYVGGSGSIASTKFDGIVDEVRIWGENISTSDFIAQSYDPGSYYGTNYTSSYENLYVHIAFSQPLASITSSATNESPYKNLSIVRTVPTNGFTTASYIRLLRSIKQYTPLVGSTIYTNKKVNIESAPSFNSNFVDGNGTRLLRKDLSIKSLEDKIYTQGQNIVSFAISPTDFINQNIMRSMGVVSVNNIIGSPRNIENTTYPTLDTLRFKYLNYYNKTIDPNQYTRFFKNLIESPTQNVRDIVPAKTKLIDGIVIESQVLNRNKTYINKSIKVDGTNTKQLNSYISGSGSLDVGAYSFEMAYGLDTQPEVTSDTLPLTTTLDITAQVTVISSTKSSLLPQARKVFQYLNTSSKFVSNGMLVTSSLLDENSGFGYLEADEINAKPLDTLTSPYPRAPYYGIPASESLAARLPSEDNTLTPLYNIPPRADLSDVGTTTYFHKNNGIYSYDIYTLYKTPYLVKLDTTVASPISRLYAKITLVNSSSVSYPGRYTTTIPTFTLSSGSSTNGSLKIANIFSLYGITSTAGLRIRLYRDNAALIADVTRSFAQAPDINSGVLFDAELNGEPDVFPYTLLQTTDSTVYYNINNITTSVVDSSINLEYFAYEPANLVPTGYLPRHYKFSRENNIGLKRRNYLGTKYTDNTEPPGCPWKPCPPFRNPPSETNTIVVTDGANTNNNVITRPTETNLPATGGGGILDVQ